MMTKENIPYTTEEIKAMVKTIESLRKTQKKYKEALERARKELQELKNKDCDNTTRRTAITIIHNLFPELKECDDKRIKREIVDCINAYANLKDEKIPTEWLDWLEKQGNKIVDCQQNHQDVKYPNGGIVMEDFNGGEGFYKLHLDYLNKKQVEEVEEMVRMWNKESKIANKNIKNCIGECLTVANEQRFKDYSTTLKDCLAWLEKQGEKKNTYKREIDDAYLQGQGESTITNVEIPFGANDSELQEVSYDIPEGFYAEIKDDRVIIKKVEPTFKVGDWIVNTNSRLIWQITCIRNSLYYIRDVNGNEGYETYDGLRDNYHLWSINDAKDGDVLVAGEMVFIFNKIHGEWVNCHCSLHSDNSLCTEDYDLLTTKYAQEIFPATKKQRDLLFKEIHDAGYAWDSEKKELKKIEPKTLDAEKVIEWMKTHGNLWPRVTIKINEVIEKFKKDFEL